MQLFEFEIKAPLQYLLAGKTADPSDSYIHDPLVLENYELILMTEGTLYITYNNIKYEINAGEFLFLPPLPAPLNLRRGYKASHCAFYWLHFQPAEEVTQKHIFDKYFMDYCASMSPDRICIPDKGKIPNMERLIILMKQLQDAVKNNYSELMCDFMATVISMELFNQITRNIDFSSSKKSQEQIYQDIILYVKLNLERNLKVCDIAAHFGYNSSYLSKLFFASSGMLLKKYIMTCKIDSANYWLTDTTNSISEIAAQLGFSDSHNFARTYKKITGLTPTEYRNAFAKRVLVYK